MNDIERRLVDDASALEVLQVSAQREAALREALANTRQQAVPAADAAPRYSGWWLPGVVAASLAIVFVVQGYRSEVSPPAPVISATPPPVNRIDPVLRPLGELATLEQVSQATALEQEWVNLRKDLAQARETIESDLPVRF